MRKFVLSIILIFSFFYAKSQAYVYHPFQYSNSIWKYLWTDVCSSSPLVFWYAEYQYRFSGDTVISGQSYAKLYMDYFDHGCFGSASFTTIYTGGMRNDTVNKKVYFRDTNHEFLLYDFNKNIGDSTLHCPGQIVIIDSVMVGSSYRKRFITSYNDTLIEGIGTVAVSGGFGDMVNPYCGMTLTPIKLFICYTDNIDWYSYQDTACSQITSVHQLYRPKIKINIIPNPVSEDGLIHYSNINSDVIKNLYFYDGRGVLIGKRENVLSDSYKIHTSELNTGLYFVKIVTQHNLEFHLKFVIN